MLVLSAEYPDDEGPSYVSTALSRGERFSENTFAHERHDESDFDSYPFLVVEHGQTISDACTLAI